MRRHLRAALVAVSLAGLLSIVPPGSSAQDSTPTIPGADDCTVEPRTEAEILAILAPDGTPVSFDDRFSDDGPTGLTVVGPADFATQQAIRDTVYQIIACGNADLPFATYALYTDAFLITQTDPESFRDFGPEGDEPLATLLEVTSILMLSDGHAFAVAVVSADDFPPVQGVGLYFELVDGRWLLDGL